MDWDWWLGPLLVFAVAGWYVTLTGTVACLVVWPLLKRKEATDAKPPDA